MDARQLKRYYLGGLSHAEQSELEARCFEQDSLFGELMAVQADLIDAYVRDQLPESERAAFRQHFLSTPAGNERVRLARTLIDAVGELDLEGRPTGAPVAPADVMRGRWTAWFGLTWDSGRRWAPAAALVVVVMGSIGLLVDDWRLRTRLERAGGELSALTQQEQRARQTSEAERARADRLSDELRRLASTRRPANELAPTAAGLVAAVSLTPGLLRGAEGAQELAIQRGASIVLLQLELEAPEPPGSYRVVIEAPDGREVWRQDAAAPRAARRESAVIVAVAVSAFDKGEYVVRLERRTSSERLETLHTYQFRVVRDSAR